MQMCVMVNHIMDGYLVINLYQKHKQKTESINTNN